MSGFTGPTGPTGIAGIYGQQGGIGAAGARGAQGPQAYPCGTYANIQYQAFYVTGETDLIFPSGGNLTRPVFTTLNPITINIVGMAALSTTTLSVPPGMYNIQASSMGITYTSTNFSTALALADVTSTPSNLLTGISATNDGMLFLDGVVTFPTQRTVSLLTYNSLDGTYTLPTSEPSCWSCFISFMKIQ